MKLRIETLPAQPDPENFMVLFYSLGEPERALLEQAAQSTDPGGGKLPEPFLLKAIDLGIAHRSGRLRAGIYQKLLREMNPLIPGAPRSDCY